MTTTLSVHQPPKTHFESSRREHYPPPLRLLQKKKRDFAQCPFAACHMHGSQHAKANANAKRTLVSRSIYLSIRARRVALSLQPITSKRDERVPISAALKSTAQRNKLRQRKEGRRTTTHTLRRHRHQTELLLSFLVFLDRGKKKTKNTYLRFTPWDVLPGLRTAS